MGLDISYNEYNRKISTKQLIKNSVIGASGMAGATIGQLLIPIPLLGAMVGGTVVAFVAKRTLDHFIEDDAKEMFRILKEEFIDQTMLANLTSDEFNEVIKLTIGSKKISKLLQSMYQSDDCRNYARATMQIAIINIIEKRQKVTKDIYDAALLEFVQ